MDSRHPLKPLDVNMLDWFLPTGKPVHVLLTKSDKLTRQEQTKTLAQVRGALEQWPNCSVQLFSSLKKQGMEETETVIGNWFAQAANIRNVNLPEPNQSRPARIAQVYCTPPAFPP